MKQLWILGIFCLSSCASLHSTVFNKIHEGDSSEKVKHILGEPEQFAPSQLIEGGTAWYYTKKEDICAVVLKDEAVKLTKCANNPNYRGSSTLQAVGLLMQGAGNGLQNSAREPSYSRPVNCTTSVIGSQAYTNCY